MLSLTLNFSTWEVIKVYLSFCATWHNFRPICPTLIIFKWWNGPTVTDKRQRVSERREWNLTSDVLSRLTEAWQRRSGLSFSGGHTDEYEDELPLSLSLSLALFPPTFYEYHLSGLCFFCAELRNHIRTLSNCSWQPRAACYFAERKNGDRCHLTLLKILSKSQLTLNGSHWRTDVLSPDAQCFIPLKLLNHNSLLAYA